MAEDEHKFEIDTDVGHIYRSMTISPIISAKVPGAHPGNHTGMEKTVPLTPDEIRNKQFSTTRLKPGYDEEEVDEFLDVAEGEFSRLIQDNENLRTQLAETLRPGKVPMSALSSPFAQPAIEMLSAFVAGSFIIPFMRAFASRAGEDSYDQLKKLLGRFSKSKIDERLEQELDHDSSIIRDVSTGTTLVIPTPMPEDAFRALAMLDPNAITGKTVVWMTAGGKWLIG